jgi:hypothetical protein
MSFLSDFFCIVIPRIYAIPSFCFMKEWAFLPMGFKTHFGGSGKGREGRVRGWGLGFAQVHYDDL